MAVERVVCERGHVIELEAPEYDPSVIGAIAPCQVEHQHDSGLIYPCGERVVWTRKSQEKAKEGLDKTD